jgi:TolB-like protein/Tfp pilus assembly protein PilF
MSDDIIPARQVEEELSAVLRSTAFARPHRLRRLLKYLVENTLAGATGALKETILGIEVFDRGPDFDPRADPIVRIDFRRLRARLDQYYGNEGAADPVLIVLEPGAYVPLFRRRGETGASGIALPKSRHSVAVLPFASLAGRAEHEFFGEGVAEEIINRLVPNRELRVIARTLAFQFRDPKQDLLAIARRLRVDTIVTGTIRGERERLRVTVQITRLADYSILWSKQYDQPPNEMLAAQEAVSAEVADFFQLFTASPASSTASALPVARKDSSAYQLFLEGKHFLHQGNADSYFRSIRCLEAAVEKDPTFARAWAELSAAYAFVLLFRLQVSPQAIARSQFAAETALQLDGQLADAHSSLGLIASLSDYRLVTAAQHFNAALRVNPNHEHARAGRAIFCFAAAGYLDRAEDELELVLSDHPPLALVNLGMVLYFDRRFEQAAQTLEAGIAMNPLMGGGWMVLGLTQERMGKTQSALEAYRRWAEVFPFPFAQAWRAAVEQCLLRNSKAARRSIEDFVAANLKGVYSVPDLVLDLLLRIGDEDGALEWLEKSYRDRAFRLIHSAVDPLFDPIRNTARFAAVLRRIIGDSDALGGLARAGQVEGVTQSVRIPLLETGAGGAWTG